jgi:transcriptional regulator with XRE-family HTH domain
MNTGQVSSPFGALLKGHRLARGLSQEALAERAGISLRAVSDLERGLNRAPRKDTLALLVAALQLAPEEQGALEATASSVVRRVSMGLPLPIVRPLMCSRCGTNELSMTGR